jgi:uncharacterized DUF497 family protein
MIQFDWDKDKNRWLAKTRGISFEDILLDIENGLLLDVIDHPNQLKYQDQQIFVVDHNGYCVMVPFIYTDNGFYLKTLFPSRKATKNYFKGD